MIAFDRESAQKLDPVIAAAILAFGFVYVHPFDDGNGRIHRYLIHHVLARREFSPAGVVFPDHDHPLRYLADRLIVELKVLRVLKQFPQGLRRRQIRKAIGGEHSGTEVDKVLARLILVGCIELTPKKGYRLSG